MWSPELGMYVSLKLGGFSGQVIAVCTYLYQADMYQVWYLDANGNPQSAWLYRDQLQPAN